MKTITIFLLWLICSLLLLAQTPKTWPDAGNADFTANWITYTRLGVGIRDQEGSTDPSNGGTTPTQYVDVVGSTLGVPSVFYRYDMSKQTLFVRMRMEVSTLTNSPDGASNDDPFNNGTWCLLIDSDADGWKEFVVMLDGQTGSPSSPLDEVSVYYENTNTQSLVSATKIFSQKMIFPDRDARSDVYDFGWGRAIQLATGPSGDFYLDWQIPLSAFNGLITENTHIAFGYSTANSNTNPLQKDVVFQGNFIAAENKQFPFGDQLTLQGGITQLPYAEILRVTGCNPTIIDAEIMDVLDVNEAGQGTIQSSIQKVSFYYRKKSGGPDILIGTQTTPYNPTVSWGLYRMVWNNASVPKDIYYVFCTATDLHNNVGISELIEYNHSCGSVGVNVSGFLYLDANHNSIKDTNELGTNLPNLFAKIFPASSPTGPALQAVAIDPATGSYSFLGIALGTYIIIVDDNSTLADVTPNIPAGWVGTQVPDQKRTNVVVTTSNVINQNFGLYNGSKIRGRVFADTGITAGIANNGIQDGGEAGIYKAWLKATNQDMSITYSEILTNANGDFTLWLPPSATTVKIIEINPAGYISVGGNAGTTSGTYTRNTDMIEFINVTGSSYTGILFADVPYNDFSPNNQQAGSPGTVISYRHTFIAGTGGEVSFSSTKTSNPNLSTWNHVIYLDTNDNGSIDAGESVVTNTTKITVTAGQKIFLIVNEFIPTNATDQAQDRIVITPQFTYTNANPALSLSTNPVEDITTVTLSSGNLKLIKNVNKQQALPGEILTYTIIYINAGTTPIKGKLFSDPISTNCDLQLGLFPGGKDILWKKPDGGILYLTAAQDADEGKMENSILYIQMAGISIPPGFSGMIQYMVKIR